MSLPTRLLCCFRHYWPWHLDHLSHPGIISMALFSACSSHICHLVASVSNVKLTSLPGTHPPAMSPKPLLFVMYTTPLISSCSLNHHLYADDTQLFLSFFPTHFDSSIDQLLECSRSNLFLDDCKSSNTELTKRVFVSLVMRKKITRTFS